MKSRRGLHAQRGQATLETAVFLPLFLLVLFGVIWTVQSSVLSERAQIAVRFSGLVSDEANPYKQYSLGALYDGLPDVAGVETYTCVAPTPDALQNDPTHGYFPGPKSPSFFQPTATTTGTCTPGSTHLSGGSMSTPLLFVHTQSNIATGVTVPGYLQSALGATQNLTASQNFFDGPDVRTIVNCYSDLGTAAEQSLEHEAVNATGAATPLPDMPNTTPLALSGSC
ncbi:MAG TPA: TadE/TadG family type IV pilus assembly protein [Candidatus Tyrphobacter sp.]